MKEYDAQEIEQKWQKRWEEEGIYQTPDKVEGKDNFYALSEFAYPSGNLHVGHWYAFAVPDIYARFKRMSGYNVLYPIGFDAFGLPAENAAIKRGLDPKEWTYANMEHMRKQLRSMGASFDWSREIVTADPSYYKWTQWMFIQFFKHGIVERVTTKANWCDSCKTVLANEQVVNGTCERCGSEVVQKEVQQWALKITDFADELLEDLDALPWDESIKQAQREWIGRKEGSEIPFEIRTESQKESPQNDADEKKVNVFTTRADTIFGATYLVLAPEHELVDSLREHITNWDEVEAYRAEVAKKSDLDRQQSKTKTGVRLQGIYAINPATGEEIPVFIADYVLADFGTGAVMAVPAHDERDAEFALKFDLPFKFVVLPSAGEPGKEKALVSFGENAFIREAGEGKKGQEKIQEEWNAMYDLLNEVHEQGGILPKGKRFGTAYEGRLINSGRFVRMTSEDARKAITEHLGGKLVKTYRIRDWGISRQRYWGTPIPIVYDPEGNPHPVPEEHLPWILPEDVDHTPDGTAPLARSKELKERTERIFGEGWTPEVDTMDTFVDSSWYFYRYLDPRNEETFAAEEKRDLWMPVDMYFGGAEHTTMHLLYARFWTKALNRIGLVKEREPFKGRLNRGLILGPDGAKMSKSKGNVIDPDAVVQQVGADTVRMYLAFIGPFNETGSYPWDPNGVVGVRRFIERMYGLSDKLAGESPEEIRRLTHKTIAKVTEDTRRLKLNTAISAMMQWLNRAEKEGVGKEEYERILRMFAAYAPHIAEEIWRNVLGHTESIHLTEWPSYDPELAKDENVTIAVQVNGKVRAQLNVPADASEEVVRETALALPQLEKWIGGKEVKKVIYVPGKILNIVVA